MCLTAATLIDKVVPMSTVVAVLVGVMAIRLWGMQTDLVAAIRLPGTAAAMAAVVVAAAGEIEEPQASVKGLHNSNHLFYLIEGWAWQTHY